MSASVINFRQQAISDRMLVHAMMVAVQVLNPAIAVAALGLRLIVGIMKRFCHRESRDEISDERLANHGTGHSVSGVS